MFDKKNSFLEGGIVPSPNITNSPLIYLPDCHKVIPFDILEKISKADNINITIPEVKLKKRKL